MSAPPTEPLVVQLVRTLRIASMHDLANQAVRVAVDALADEMARVGAVQSELRIEVFDRGVYLDQAFWELRGAAYETAEQLTALFARLEIDEMAIVLPMTPREIDDLLRAVVACANQEGVSLVRTLRHPRVTVRTKTRAKAVQADRRTALARAYAQLLVLTAEAFDAIRGGEPARLVRLRRGVQELVDAAEGLENVLVGLAVHQIPEAADAGRAVSTAALTERMLERLTPDRAARVEITLAALLHDIGALHPAPPGRAPALHNALALGAVTTASNRLDRVAVALEATPSEGGPPPGVPAGLVTVASAFVRSLAGGDGAADPARQMRALLDATDLGLDRRIVRLFLQVVGLYPPGSLVRLSDGTRAVVVDGRGADPTRPVVRRLDGDLALVELDHRPEIRIESSLDPRTEPRNPTHFLLA